MAKINSAWVHEDGKTEINARVADATEALLKTITILDELAKPKQFNLSSANLCRFDQLPSNGSRHSVRVQDDILVDEIVKWQVYGNIGGRIVNVVVYHLFHTHKDNRSGSGEFFINGKTDRKPEYGGITLDDVWQDNDKWKYELEFLKSAEVIA